VVAAVVYSATDSKGSFYTTTSAIRSYATSSSATVISTTDQYGHSVVLSVSGLTSGAVITTTDAAGSSITTTYHPSGDAVQSVILQTTTLPDGSQAVVTATAYVLPTEVAATTTGAAAAATSTDTASPSLQTGAAGRVGVEVAAMIGGAMGVAWLL